MPNRAADVLHPACPTCDESAAGNRRPGAPAGAGARQPDHTVNQPVPILARIVWEQDGEEHVETVALGWTAMCTYGDRPAVSAQGGVAGRRGHPAMLTHL